MSTPVSLEKENRRYAMALSRVIDRVGSAISNIDTDTVLGICESILDIMADTTEGY
jgi:hypothetical protein